MRIVDLIIKKRNGLRLSDEEIAFFVNGSVSGEIADYQITAMLMAIWFSGMDAHETAVLTDCMARSGDMMDLSSIPGIKVDKHSTGGVGDKTTLVVAPIVAACGVPVAKMSGRGLGHTGGTLDKLESIPGMSVNIPEERFFDIVRSIGLSVIGQSGDMARADKIFYALRDVTGTVDSIPLIASSIMSKKLAAGADAIVLDVKSGSGAFMKTPESAAKLAEAMVSIGEANGRRTVALITDMAQPLGFAVGNSLEVIEAVDTLRLRGPADLTELCLRLSSEMLYLAGKGDAAKCRSLAQKMLENGAALEKFKAMVSAQGGDAAALDDVSMFKHADFHFVVHASEDGYISSIDAEAVGLTASLLGAGRSLKTDPVDHSAGLVMHKKIGDKVTRGEALAELFTSKNCVEDEASRLFSGAIGISAVPPSPQKLVRARVTKDGTEWC